jgi:hypothetical protein
MWVASSNQTGGSERNFILYTVSMFPYKYIPAGILLRQCKPLKFPILLQNGHLSVYLNSEFRQPADFHKELHYQFHRLYSNMDTA